MRNTAADRPRLFVACLCAAWCRTCEDYRATFDALRAEFHTSIECAWVDIEDKADLLDEVDIETFPTLLISADDVLLFLGPVLPSPHSARQVVQRALEGKFGVLGDPELKGLPAKLRT